MRVLMIAPPGAGKGTQGALIGAHFGIPHIATGELLRDHVARQTALGQTVQEYLDAANSYLTRPYLTCCGRRWSPQKRPEASLS
jgi:adenylate kinase family enzyme